MELVYICIIALAFGCLISIMLLKSYIDEKFAEVLGIAASLGLEMVETQKRVDEALLPISEAATQEAKVYEGLNNLLNYNIDTALKGKGD